MALQQCPFALVALQQVGGHRHLGARHVRAERLADAAEGQVADGGERREVELAAKVDALLLLRPDGQLLVEARPWR